MVVTVHGVLPPPPRLLYGGDLSEVAQRSVLESSPVREHCRLRRVKLSLHAVKELFTVAGK